MNDMPILYVGTARVPETVMLSWRAAVELVFAERDLKVVLRARLDRAVLQVLDHGRRNEPAKFVYLIAPPRDIRARLNVYGYTENHCRSAWLAARDELAARRRRRAEQDGDTLLTKQAELELLTWEDWGAGIREPPPAAPKGRGTRAGEPWHAMGLLGVNGDPLVSLRLLLDALEEPAWMDCDYLYEFEKDASASPHDLARRDEGLSSRWPEGRITVLTEGRSDARIVSAALRALHPELANAYQFLDFDEFRIEGGAWPLARMVRVLSSARMGSRLLAMFDNDAAGIEAMEEIAGLRLPPNVRLMVLPYIPIARRYPTLSSPHWVVRVV